MAIKKVKMMDCGVNAEYHKISNLAIDNDNKKCSFQLSSYINKAAKDLGKLPVEVKRFALIQSDEGSLEEAYDYLKGLPENSNSEDV